MNKLMMVAGAVALAGMMTGCATGKAGEDKVANWQKERTPVEVLKSKIEIKAAGAVVEALDVVPFGIYKGIADKVDSLAAIDRSRRAWLRYKGTVDELVEVEKKSKEEALKIANEQLNSLPDAAEVKAQIKTYIAETQKMDFQPILDWIKTTTEELQKATEKFANETPNALNQLIEIAKKEGGMAVIKIPSQGKDDLAVIGNQLKDAGLGLAMIVEMVNADREAAKVGPDYPIEG